MNSSTSTLVKDLDVWYKDTNIQLLVLQAGNQLFRVPRDRLEEESSVFKDMLAIPQPNPKDTLEGFPLIFLPDPASEVKCFLKGVLKVEG